MGIKAFVFDMDGTILHSLPDLAIATNEALTQMGFPTHTQDEIVAFVGNGAERLIDQSCPPYATAAERKETLELWRSIYISSSYENTAPFPGIIEVLESLRRLGMRTAVLSNKFDAGVQVLSERFFPGLFDISRGEIAPIPRKPDPTSLFMVMEELGVSAQETVYVGDTNVDVQVARAAGVMAVGVSWGYDKALPLPVEELDAYIHDPHELLALAGFKA